MAKVRRTEWAPKRVARDRKNVERFFAVRICGGELHALCPCGQKPWGWLRIRPRRIRRCTWSWLLSPMLRLPLWCIHRGLLARQQQTGRNSARGGRWATKDIASTRAAPYPGRAVCPGRLSSDVPFARYTYTRRVECSERYTVWEKKIREARECSRERTASRSIVSLHRRENG